MRKVTIKFYAHKIFPANSGVSDLFRAVDMAADATKTVAHVFGGKSKSIGNGSEIVQYDDVVQFDNLSEEHEKVILASYSFASIHN